MTLNNYAMARKVVEGVAESVEAAADANLTSAEQAADVVASIEPAAAVAQVFATLAVADAIYDLATAVRCGG